MACRWLDPASNSGNRDGAAADRRRYQRALFARHELTLRHLAASTGYWHHSRLRPQDRGLVAARECHRGSSDAASAYWAAGRKADAGAGRRQRLAEAESAGRPAARGRTQGSLRRDDAYRRPAIELGGSRDGQCHRAIDRADQLLASLSQLCCLSGRSEADAERRHSRSRRANRAQAHAHGSGHRAVISTGGRRRYGHMCVLLDRDRMAGRRRRHCLRRRGLHFICLSGRSDADNSQHYGHLGVVHSDCFRLPILCVAGDRRVRLALHRTRFCAEFRPAY